MFRALGVNWAGTLLGCVAVVLIPIPIVFYRYGAKIRGRSAFAPTFPTPIAPAEDEEMGVPADEEKATRPTNGTNFA
jgi:DHA1 family multidrug resistance protein-like MFS transporter